MAAAADGTEFEGKVADGNGQGEGEREEAVYIVAEGVKGSELCSPFFYGTNEEGEQQLHFVSSGTGDITHAASGRSVGNTMGQPSGAATDAEGNLYVTDYADAAVLHITADGEKSLVVKEYEGKPFKGPNGIVTDANNGCLLYTSPSPRDGLLSRMPSSA